MTLQVYSTLSRKKDAFHKKPGEHVSMYVCGPTVYKPSHIGHMVGPVIFDTVKRYLTYLGFDVTWVVNITDVDDKLIVRAKELNTTVPELAERMTKDYHSCLTLLNVTGIDRFPKATEHIGGMIAIIAKLVETEHAYPANGDVYFDVAKDADYGKLCGFDPEQLEVISKHCEMGLHVIQQISQEEFQSIRRHAQFGASILDSSDSPLLSMAAQIAMTHHEKWDGTGYPFGIAGEEIPIEGRIVAVADVFDALSTSRPYKAAFPLEKCLSILAEGCGRHFDPQVVDAFFAHRDEFVSIMLQYADNQ